MNVIKAGHNRYYAMLKKAGSIKDAIDNFSLGNIENNRTGATLIKVNALTKKYSKTVVINNVDLEINEGDRIALMGANGAGKTTLVEMICGLIEPTQGKIDYFLGDSNFKKKIGIQFQENHYPPGIKVSHLVDFYRDIYRKTDTGMDINALINKFDIIKLYKKEITKLSGGELQRVNILLSIINNPKIIFFDEISTGLDIQAKLKIVDLIKELQEKYNWTLVIITHNVEDIVALCNRVVVMSRGVKVVDEYSETILDEFGSYENFITKKVRSTLTEEQPQRTKKKRRFAKNNKENGGE